MTYAELNGLLDRVETEEELDSFMRLWNLYTWHIDLNR
jgi:hypothetical protein